MVQVNINQLNTVSDKIKPSELFQCLQHILSLDDLKKEDDCFAVLREVTEENKKISDLLQSANKRIADLEEENSKLKIASSKDNDYVDENSKKKKLTIPDNKIDDSDDDENPKEEEDIISSNDDDNLDSQRTMETTTEMDRRHSRYRS